MNRSPAVAVIHPDHLLDRARAARQGLAGAGALPPEDWQRLGAHLSACSACAWEQSATDDFGRARASSEGDLDPARLDALIAGALARAGLVQAGLVQAGLVQAGARDTDPGSGIVVLRPARFAARRLAAAAMVAAAIGAAMALPARAPREGPHADPQLTATTEASLDAGALGAPSGGDS